MRDNKSLTIAAAAADVTRKPRGLDERVWLPDESMRPEVREALLKVAQDVWTEVEEEGGAELVDITLTGSTTGERWSPLGDLDVHLVVRYSEDDSTSSYFTAKGKAWNVQHDIEVAGHPVEVYVQDESEPHYSAGVYSLLDDEWTQRQDPGEWAPYRDVAKKAKALAAEMRKIFSDLKGAKGLSELDVARAMMKKLRSLRSVGLQRDGEGSVENLAYKALRRAGYIDRLVAARNEAFDRILMDDAGP